MDRESKTPTMADVARLANVSVATVSYILNGQNTRASDTVRQRVLDAVEELGYVRNQAARNLRRQASEQVCLVVPRLGLTYYDALAYDLQAESDNRDYSMVMAVGGSSEREYRVLDRLRRGMADGVIISPRFLNEHDLALLAQSGVAVVAISNYIRQPKGFDLVRITDREASVEATRYLIANGHHQIVFFGQLNYHSMHNDRLTGYQQGLTEAGLDVDDSLIRSNVDSRKKAYDETRALIESGIGFSAIFAASDTLAISAMWAIRDAGLRVPDDVAIIGVGNHPEGWSLTPALTTIGLEDMDYGDVISLLFSRIEAPEPLAGRVHIRKWSLIRRGTA